MKTKNSLIILFVVVVVIVGILFYVYNEYEKPKQIDVVVYTNLSVAVFDDEQKQTIVTTSVFINDMFAKNITTTSHGFVLVKIPINSTIRFDIDELDYYHESVSYNILSSSNKRITIDLVPSGEVSINSTLDKANNQINLKVFSSNEFRNPTICTTWGLHIIWISSIDNLQQISISSKYDKCFKIDSINSTKQTFSFVYDNYGVFDSSDFINFYVIDEKDNIEEKKVGLF